MPMSQGNYEQANPSAETKKTHFFRLTGHLIFAPKAF